DDGEASLAALSPDERAQVLLAMITLAKRVAAPLEDAASVVRRATWLARTRIAIAMGILVPALAWAAVRLTVAPNLAYHRPVVVSESDVGLHIDPKYVVDGDRTNLGFHTTAHPNTNITIDLGAAMAIRRIE